MEFSQVSSISIMGMLFTLVLSVGFPVIFCIAACRKTNAKFTSVLWGCTGFIVFALILEQILHMVVLGMSGNAIKDNIWLYALYGSLAAALFEETGRFIIMKFFMRKRLERQNALLYGIGHGGIEAILLVGFTSISNMVVSLMINTGKIDTVFTGLDSASQDLIYQQLSQLCTSPPYQFFLGGVERISALIFQIALSIIVYKAVKYEKFRYLILALVLHFALDFIAITAQNYFNVIIVEIIILIISLVIGFYGLIIFKADKKQNNLQANAHVR